METIVNCHHWVCHSWLGCAGSFPVPDLGHTSRTWDSSFISCFSSHGWQVNDSFPFALQVSPFPRGVWWDEAAVVVPINEAGTQEGHEERKHPCETDGLEYSGLSFRAELSSSVPQLGTGTQADCRRRNLITLHTWLMQ